MHARIFIVANIYAYLVSEASLSRDEGIVTTNISSRERETHVRLFELVTQRTKGGERKLYAVETS